VIEVDYLGRLWWQGEAEVVACLE